LNRFEKCYVSCFISASRLGKRTIFNHSGALHTNRLRLDRVNSMELVL
jgi:hypothetical protein